LEKPEIVPSLAKNQKRTHNEHKNNNEINEIKNRLNIFTLFLKLKEKRRVINDS